MNKLLAVVVMILLSALVKAEEPIFADIQWGTSLDEVRNQLISKGFVSVGLDKDGDLMFEGSLIGFKAIGIARFWPGGGVGSILVSVITPDDKAVETYKIIKNNFIKKHGPPSAVYELFYPPYYDGDGFETQAFRLGKGFFLCGWGTPLCLEISKQLTVRIIYESKNWSIEVERQRARSLGVL